MTLAQMGRSDVQWGRGGRLHLYWQQIKSVVNIYNARGGTDEEKKDLVDIPVWKQGWGLISKYT